MRKYLNINEDVFRDIWFPFLFHIICLYLLINSGVANTLAGILLYAPINKGSVKNAGQKYIALFIVN